MYDISILKWKWKFSVLIESLFRVDDGVIFKVNITHLTVVLSVELKSRLSVSKLIYYVRIQPVSPTSNLCLL